MLTMLRELCWVMTAGVVLAIFVLVPWWPWALLTCAAAAILGIFMAKGAADDAP